jgi:plastocyanin
MGRRALWIAALVLAGLAPVVPARAATTGVEVHNNFFKAARVRIEPGDTVQWNVVDGGHTITADDGSFDLPEGAAGGAVVNPGDRFAVTFPTRGIFAYHCRIHGFAGAFPGGMTGAVYVGLPFDNPPTEVRRVPAQYRTIGAALHGITPGSTVSIAPGVYHVNLEPVGMFVRDVTVQGEGSSPADVVIDAGGEADNGVELAANGVVLRNLSVRGAKLQGVFVHGMQSFTIQDVRTDGALFGVQVQSASAGTVRGVQATGFAATGIDIASCSSCGIWVDRVQVNGAGTGVSLSATSGVVVSGARISSGTTGIRVADSQGVDVTGSSIDGGTVGIDVSAVLRPSLDVRISSNQVTTASASGSDLQWDLVGARVCFSANTDPTTPVGTPSSKPPMLQTLFPCSR